jgi:HD-GYP domain-containing protein (c-di-GMP phosphodiesterase class II)
MDFSATQRYDAQHGYRSHSMLLVPLLDHHGETRGILQLINKHHSADGFIPYTAEDERIIQALGAQAAVAINNQKLIGDLERLFESFLHAITLALDKQSKHTGGHIRKMVDLTMMIVDAIEDDDGPFAAVHFTPQERKTIELSAMMHDIGKITTPTHLVDKGTKLEAITDRIELIRWRLNALKNQAGSPPPTESFSEEIVEEAYHFLSQLNHGEVFFDEDAQKNLQTIAQWQTQTGEERHPVLTADEIKHLSIPRGTLSPEERTMIERHAADTIELLESIHFPAPYRRIPEIAGGHHEKLNGQGYPKRLHAKDIALETRILAVADIFEALTASDRPYRQPNTLSQAMGVLKRMSDAYELDENICRMMYEKKIYLAYGSKHLDYQQIDEVEMDWVKK